LSDPLSVYIHLPFCLKKCSYCDFYSVSILGLLPAYVSSLQREIEMRTGKFNRTGPAPQVRTIYFGGGTPSLLSLSDVEKILQTICTCYPVSRDAEITLEVNPGTVDKAYLSGLKKLGVNRLSIGVQSFDAQKIKVLGRIHTVETSIEAIQAAKSAGFENIGLDLIYGTPGETREDWLRDLKTALGFKVAHLSCYMLTLEKGTPLQTQYAKGLFKAPGPDLLSDLFMATSTFLEQQGYEHYEISNFARGRENRSCHNANYWQMIPYDGFGPSAHSFGFSSAQKDQAQKDQESWVRSWNIADLGAYIESLSSNLLPVHEREVLTVQQQMLERVMLGLRTRDGLDIAALEQMMGQGAGTLSLLLARLETQKLGEAVTGPGRRFALTLSGRARLDSIVEAFVEIIL
jgi:putative oxygen-independent coproporphyrinogen III oxidase